MAGNKRIFTTVFDRREKIPYFAKKYHRINCLFDQTELVKFSLTR